jgi:hypothetical protein
MATQVSAAGFLEETQRAERDTRRARDVAGRWLSGIEKLAASISDWQLEYHGRKSKSGRMILTSNLAFGCWDQPSAGDRVLTATMFDRLLLSQILPGSASLASSPGRGDPLAVCRAQTPRQGA